MEFADLYALAQEMIATRIADGKVAAIVPVAELKIALIDRVDWLDDINIHPIDAKDGDPLAHYECYSDTDSKYEEPTSWVVLITYASDLSNCEKRFVWCKEMMHIFDTEGGCVKTEEQYRGLLSEIELKPLEPSEAYLSENQAKWLALLILCPKPQRDAMMRRKASEGLTDYDVALHFRIPEAVVPSLFSEYYDRYYARFLEG